MGPLAGLRIIEIAAIGPAPLCAMMLADMGAEVIRIDRTDAAAALLPIAPEHDIVARGRRALALDLKSPAGIAALLRLIEGADGLIEGFRPGVAERLGFGPDACLVRNPRLVYGRMTGYGQTGPLAQAAGHDINYIALTGALHAIGPAGGDPVPPLNLVGDYAGGTMFLAFGMACAFVERGRSGLGQVVDAAMVDGVNVLMSLFHTLRAAGMWETARAANLLDGGAPFYATYRTADDRHVAVGALEPKFFAELARRIGLDPAFVRAQHDRALWPAMRARMAAIFATRTRDDWAAELAATDSCVSPVLTLDEAAPHPHAVARAAFDGQGHPAPAPRFSRSAPGPAVGAGGDAVLRDFGFGAAEIAALRSGGAVGP